MSRRQTLAALAAAGAASALPAQAADPTTDWSWLVGDWDVRHRRLRERLAGSTTWDEFSGRSALWLTLGGLGTIDDNALDLPGGAYRALGVRAFDPASGQWSIWWLDPRNPGRIDPPVRGRFEGDTAAFLGEDSLRGQPILVRFQWSDIHGPRPHWRQAFSPDGGATWEMNWENFFTRTSAAPSPLPWPAAASPPAPHDWAFLVGRWAVRHRKRRRRMAGDDSWDSFEGTLTNWPVMGGQGNVGDNLFNVAGGAYRGVGLRAYDPAAGDWLSWWLDGRDPTRIGPPVRGRFEGGVGTFIGDDTHEGRPVRARVLWSGITARSARWEQAFSADGGASWETNWVSDFTRLA